jgi:TPR repeat protein
MLASENPTLYDCVVAGFGIYDLPLLFNASNYRSGDDFGEYIAAVVGENTADKVEVSPVYYAEKLQAPVLIIAGKKDTIAGFEQSNRMRYMLERANKNVEYYFYENSGHGHDNYILDHHELALTLDFLYRQLGIPISAPGDLSEQDVELIARQYMLIADGYDNEKMMPRDIKKSAQYLSKARDYGHPRAFFNLAAHHSQGKVLALDLLKAREYYETAALLGYKNAHQRLAYGYMPNAVGISDNYEVDEEKALLHLNAAIEHDPSKVNQKRLAYFYCIASALYKDVDKCLAGFKESLGNSTFYDDMRDEFAMAVIDGSYTQNEKDKMTAFAEKWFGLTHISFEADIADVGIFEYKASGKYGKSGEYELSEATSLSQVNDKISEKLIALGVRFVPDTEGLPYQIDRTLALIEWLEKDSQNVLLRRDFVTIKRAPTGDWIRYFKIDSLPPVGTSYTLNIYSADGTLNYTKTFNE